MFKFPAYDPTDTCNARIWHLGGVKFALYFLATRCSQRM